MGWIRRLRGAVNDRTVRASIDEELAFHLAERTDELVRAGMPPAAARREAVRRFGGVALTTERTRDADVVRWLDSLLTDVRLAVRSLRRAPGLVALSAISLGLGMGLNLTLYSMASAIFLHAPTMSDADRVFGVEPGNGRQWSFPNYRDVRDSGIFADTVAFRTASLTWRRAGDLERVGVMVVSANFFEGLGVSARLGRTFSAVEADPARAPRQIVLTHNYWMGRFAGDPAAIGQRMTLNGEPFEVVGVLPDDFRSIAGFMSPAAYVPISPLALPTIEDRGSESLDLVARLREGDTPARAEAAVATLAKTLEDQYPERNEGLGRAASLFPARSLQFRGTPAGFTLLPIALALLFGLVLLLGAANVAGLLLARATARRHELSIRAALGARRGRVVQALLVESLVLAAVGVTAGLVVTYTLSRAPLPYTLSGLQPFFAPDWQLWWPSLALVLIAALLCGLGPAVRATRRNVTPGLRVAEPTQSSRSRLRNALVVAQVAMSLTLIVIATLCFRSQAHAFATDVGFDLDHGVVARFALDPDRDTTEARLALSDRVVARVEGLPGVTSAAPAAVVPLGGDALVASFHPAGRSDVPGVRPTTLSVGPRYFQTLRIPLLRGREFDPADGAGGQPVAIVNQTFANTYLADRDPLGRPIEIGGEALASIVGVVRDSKVDTIGEAPKSVVYYPYAQRPRRLTIVMHTDGAPGAMVPAIRRAIAEIDPTVNVGVTTLREAASTELEMRRTGTVFVGAIGVVGMLLAAIGLYGIVAYLVASRTVELGIRMALGASPGRLRRDVMRQAARLVASGLAIGALLSMMITPALATFLAGLSPLDPIAYATGALLLLIVALAASYVPARGVTRVDPIAALRR